MINQNRQRLSSVSRWLLLIGIAVSFGLSGCSWVTELIMVNTIDRPCDTEGLSRDERIRKFEENFLRERDREANGFID